MSMKQLATMLALAGMLSAPAMSAQLGGISGTVVDAKTGQPMAHATLYYYRSPYLEKGPNHIATLQPERPRFLQRRYAGPRTVRRHGEIPR